MSTDALEAGYWRAYRDFYRWSNIGRAALNGGTLPHRLRRFAYAAGWKKFEPLWDLLIRTRRLASMLPLLEGILDRPDRTASSSTATVTTSASEVSVVERVSP
jgi:hypothetical protein